MTSAADVVPALLGGVVAGLGVALPLGAVSVLLLQEGMVRGRRAALAAAGGVASVDVVYASLAVVAGGAIASALAGRESAVRLVGAAVLAALGARGLWSALADRVGVTAGEPAPARAGAPYWRFFALTALNPLTAVYFTVLAAASGDRLRGVLPSAAFVVGVLVASGAWQATLALAGAAAGARLPVAARRWTTAAGSAVVLALAVALALSA